MTLYAVASGLTLVPWVVAHLENADPDVNLVVALGLHACGVMVDHVEKRLAGLMSNCVDL